jgi:hypothetical protein
MKKVKLFEEFINEGSLQTGESGDVTIKDMTTYSGKEISAEEILGLIVSNKTEDDMIDAVYKKYGQTTFSEEDISTLRKDWNDYNADKKEAELEAEKEKEEGAKGDGEAGGDDENTDDAMKELGI